MYHGPIDTTSITLLKRKINLQPFVTDKVKINVTEGSPDFLAKLELYGTPMDHFYKQNPVLDEVKYRKGICKFTVNT